MLNGFSEIIVNNYVIRAKHFEHFLCARPCVKQFTLNTQQPCKQSHVTTFISQRKKLRCNEDKSLSQGHTGPRFNPRNPTLKPTPLINLGTVYTGTQRKKSEK